MSNLEPQRTGDSPPEAGSPDPAAGRRRLFWGAAAVGLGLVAQIALTGGQPLLGILGLASAAVLFVANTRPYLAEAPASRWDRRQATPAAGEPSPDPEHLEQRPPLPAGTADLRGRVAYVKHNWRELTIAEILSGAMPSPPWETVSGPASPPPPRDPASTDLGDAPEGPSAGEE